MDRPRLSIVTATYNRSQVLRHTIGTVVGQRFSDWELLVVGDACTDDTEDVVASFADRRIRYLQLSRNVGEQSGPNNAGVAQARGDLIAFLNHDDLWFQNHLELLVSALTSTSADLVFSLMATMIPGHPPALSNVSVSGRYEPSVVAPASSWLFRRTLWQKVGPWRSYRECYQAPSQDWLLRAMRAGGDLRLVPELTVIAFPSGYRRGSYTTRDDGENAGYAQRLRTEPLLRERLLTEIALGQAAGDVYGLSTTAVLPYLTRGLRNAARVGLSAVGLSPASVRLFLTSPRKGYFIDTLRHARGLPPLRRERTKEP